MKHPRTLSRQIALQYLYMYDLMGEKEAPQLSDYLGQCDPAPAKNAVAFARILVDAVLEHQEELDNDIAAAAENWKMSRMAIVDRNILRIGLAELICCPDIPCKVVLDEAIELARRFSNEDACAFVNGLLDCLRKKHRPEDDVPERPRIAPSVITLKPATGP